MLVRLLVLRVQLASLKFFQMPPEIQASLAFHQLHPALAGSMMSWTQDLTIPSSDLSSFPYYLHKPWQCTSALSNFNLFMHATELIMHT